MSADLLVYVQNVRVLTRKSDISAILEAFANRSQVIVDELRTRGMNIESWQVAEFCPSYATPMQYKETRDPDSWGLWNSFKVNYAPADVGRIELEAIALALSDSLSCGVHIHRIGEGGGKLTGKPPGQSSVG